MLDDRSFSSVSFDSRSWGGLGAFIQVVNDWLLRFRRRMRR